MSFKLWLKIARRARIFGVDNSPEETFVEDTFRDKDFGKYKTWDELHGHLIRKRACAEAIEAGENVFNCWRKENE